MTYSASDLVYSYLVTATVPENDPLFLGTYLSITVSEPTQQTLAAFLQKNGMQFTNPKAWHATIFKTVLYRFDCRIDPNRRVELDPRKCKFELYGRQDVLGLTLKGTTYFENRKNSLVGREQREAERLHVRLPNSGLLITDPHLTLSNRGRPEDVSRLNAAWSSYTDPLILLGERQADMRLKHPRRESTPMIRRDIAESLREDRKKR